MQPTHVVIVGLDGLRADMMTPDTTPHLLRLAEQGVWLSKHHAVFPTARGSMSQGRRGGLRLGHAWDRQQFVLRAGVAPDTVVDCGKYQVVEAADAFYGGALLGTRAWENSSQHTARLWWP